jgi:hypothetical protein
MGNGNGSAVDKTCAQGEIIALDNYRFLVLARDGSGLGNSSPNPNVYKSFLLVDTTLGAAKIAANAARNAEGGLITTAQTFSASVKFSSGKRATPRDFPNYRIRSSGPTPICYCTTWAKIWPTTGRFFRRADANGACHRSGASAWLPP